MDSNPAKHWDEVHRTRSATEVSWYQPAAEVSLALVERARLERGVSTIDVGAGGSTFVDGLLDRGFSDVTLLDISGSAFDATRARLGHRAGLVHYLVADVTAWEPARAYELWHDRAVFHFLTDEPLRQAYRDTLRRALAPGGHAVVATFAENGPERCSGLSVQRYSAEELVAEFAGELEPMVTEKSVHLTPAGGSQAFTFVLFRRRP
jgi:SAM-dependent methyltransferase